MEPFTNRLAVHKSCFISPRDGDMLSDVAGIRKEDGLEIEVYIGAAQGALVEINGTSAHWNGKCFATKVLLNQYRNVVTADINGKQDTVCSATSIRQQNNHGAREEHEIRC